MSIDGNLSSFFFFGLSGAGKTTLISALCADAQYGHSKFTVSRSPRPDDDLESFEYVNVEAFKRYRQDKAFFIDDDDGTNFYGYRFANLVKAPFRLFYGLPSKLQEITSLGAKCILIQADARQGLRIRGDESALRLKRQHSNIKMMEHFYSDPVFLEKMDLILENTFSGIGNLEAVFKQFTALVVHETRALAGNLESLNTVLKAHYNPFSGLISHFSLWIRRALTNSKAAYLFYSRILSQEIAINAKDKRTFKKECPQFGCSKEFLGEKRSLPSTAALP